MEKTHNEGLQLKKASKGKLSTVGDTNRMPQVRPEVHETNKFPIPHSYFREPEVCLYLNQVRNEQKKTRVTFKNVLSKLIPTECMRF